MTTKHARHFTRGLEKPTASHMSEALPGLAGVFLPESLALGIADC
jgi:hypothetical protein